MELIFNTFCMFLGFAFGAVTIAHADDHELVDVSLDNDVRAAITHLLETTPAAKELATTAKGALVFQM